MKTRHLEHRWVRGLMTAAMVLAAQAGGEALPGNPGLDRAGAGTAVTAPAAGPGIPAQAAGQTAPEPAEPAGPKAGKRDPFRLPPPPRETKQEDDPLPPGKRGLIVSRLQLKGIVHQAAGGSPIAVVTPQTNRAYFLRVHDEVYHGVVSAITADSIRFRVNQPAGRGLIETREIVLRLGSPSEEGR